LKSSCHGNDHSSLKSSCHGSSLFGELNSFCSDLPPSRSLLSCSCLFYRSHFPYLRGSFLF
jgi:hypothetical protein